MDNSPAAGITEAKIQENVDSLNRNFAPICVSFEICEFRYISNSYYNTIKNENWKEMQILYNVDNRINIYYVNDINLPSASPCGFAAFKGIGDFTKEGIAIKKIASCTGSTSKTLSHEMGHYFGLSHTFETAGELANGSNCATAGDQICDTPADPFVTGDDPNSYVDGSCKFISMKKDANGQYYDPIVGNIMSYYPDRCACGFTHDQLLLMARNYLSLIGMW